MGSVQPEAPQGQQYTKKIDYNYDDDGNRASVVTTLWQQSPTTTSYSTNNLNEYTSVGGTTHVWDANGNLTDDGTLKYKYNYKNLIVEVRKKSDNSLVAKYKYDSLGRRVEKSVGGDVERHVLSLSRFADSYRLLSRVYPDSVNGRENVQDLSHVISTYDGSNNWLQNFVWNDEVDGVQVLEQADLLDYDTDGNTTEITRSFYHRNALGSVMEITDMNEATVVSYRYDPYGKITITRAGQTQSSDPLGQHWAFTGRYQDEESGLLYYRARYYDPVIGRFIQRDPLGIVAGPNLFAYVDSTPTTRTDPSGLQSSSGKSAMLREIERYLEKEYDPDKFPPRDPNKPLNTGKVLGKIGKIVASHAWDAFRGLDDPVGRSDDGFSSGFHIEPELSSNEIGLGLGWSLHASEFSLGGATFHNFKLNIGFTATYDWQWDLPDLNVHFEEDLKLAFKLEVQAGF